MSGELEQEYFADGIVEDLITALSHLRWLFVIARNSTFTYKGQAVDVARVGRELGVRYILEGSVRRLADRVRITVQFIEAEKATQIWAQRFDRPVEDIFALQDEITDCIAGALEPEISASERDRARRKQPEHLGAWELYQRGMWHVLQHNREHFIEAQTLFRRASQLDPNFAAPHAGLAIVDFHQFARMWTNDPAAIAQEMFKEASLAVELDPNDSLCHVALGLAFIQQHQLSHATAEHEVALSLNPSSAFARWGYGQVLVRTNRFEEALQQCEAALRLSPRDPRTWQYFLLRASAFYQLRRYEEAAKWAREATRHPTADTLWPYIYLASSSAQLGRTSEAADAIEELRRMRPNVTVTSLLLWSNMRIRSAETLEHILEGLRKAGLPD
jgi:TolB-like protein/Tfp pilus assembly protein PilF